MRNDLKSNEIVRLTFEFALLAIRYSQELEREKKYALGRQFFRSATSVGACVREAQNAESLADFIHKMKMAAKEADESAYWLELCHHIGPSETTDELIRICTSIIRILSKIISSSKAKLKNGITSG